MSELDSRNAPMAIGGGLEGAEHTSRETANWHPSFGSADMVINPVKPLADARTQDMVTNDGYAAGAVNLHRDNIVGSQYRLNARPNSRMLDAPEGWAEEFQKVAENTFNTLAESEACWFDASGRNTFSGLINLSVSSMVITGEALGTAEWITNRGSRPFNSALQLIAAARLSNPFDEPDTQYRRGGQDIDQYGYPLAYHIRQAHPSELWDYQASRWQRVDATTPWGRRQVMHIYQPLLPAQSRGVSEMVSALKQMRMTKKFNEIVLQNAVINASYAAAVESDLPPAQVFEMLGAGQSGTMGGKDPLREYFRSYLSELGAYMAGSKNVMIDGAKIPHLFPGTKLNLKPIGTPGGVGTTFEQSMLRHIAACLGLSYEEFSRDYTKTNYSSARASMNNTWKSMQSKKRAGADRTANFVYELWVEEMVVAGNLPLPPGKTWRWFYEPGVKDALCRATWIGAARGQVDEKKETEAAGLRMSLNMSTLEIECARHGLDWREVLDQVAREKKYASSLGLDLSANKEPAKSATTQQGEEEEQEEETVDE